MKASKELDRLIDKPVKVVLNSGNVMKGFLRNEGSVWRIDDGCDCYEANLGLLGKVKAIEPAVYEV